MRADRRTGVTSKRAGALAVLLASALLMPWPALADSLHLRLNEDIRSDLAPNQLPVPPGAAGVRPTANTNDMLNVTLYPRQMVVEAPKQIRFYDFDARTLTTLDPAAKTATQIPLYAIPIFKSREKSSRLAVATQQQALAIQQESPQPAFDVQPFDIDMMYGSDKDISASAGAITKSNVKDQVFYNAGNRTLGSYTLSQTAIPADLKDTYHKFLVYEMAIHPVMKTEITAQPNVFRTLIFENRDLHNMIDSKYTLQDANVSGASSYTMPDGYSVLTSSNARFNTLVAKGAAGRPPTLNDYTAKITGLLSASNPRDAVLAANEMMLTYPDQEGRYKALVQSTFDAANRDSGVADMLRAITSQPKSEADLQPRLQILRAAQDKSQAYGYLLNLFMANHIRTVYGAMPLLNPDQKKLLDGTEGLMLTTLEGNPYLASAYIDLGNAYFQDFNMEMAWAAWAQARRLSPNNPNLAAVQAQETQALAKFPEYF